MSEKRHAIQLENAVYRIVLRPWEVRLGLHFTMGNQRGAVFVGINEAIKNLPDLR